MVLLTGSDSDNDPLTFQVASTPANGSLSGTAPNLIYTPNTDFTGVDSFTFITNDGQMDSVIGTVNITVVALPLKITILEPVDMSTVSTTVAVSGRLKTNATYGNVAINGRRATVQDNQFFINDLQLELGDNEIVIAAVDSNQNQTSASINVFAEDIVQEVSMTLGDPIGIAPYSTSLKASFINIEPILDSAIVSSEGSGEIESNKVSDAEFNLTFTTPGLYTITYSMESTDEIPYNVDTQIIIKPPFDAEDWQQMQTDIESLEDVFLSQVNSDDIETIRNLVLETARNNPDFSSTTLSGSALCLVYKDLIPIILDLPDPNGSITDSSLTLVKPTSKKVEK